MYFVYLKESVSYLFCTAGMACTHASRLPGMCEGQQYVGCGIGRARPSPYHFRGAVATVVIYCCVAACASQERERPPRSIRAEPSQQEAFYLFHGGSKIKGWCPLHGGVGGGIS